jgi:tRNA(Ile)-lysidine synthase
MDELPPPPQPEPFLARFCHSWPPPQWQDVTVVVAVSGGADSVSLLRALASLRNQQAEHLVAAHVNHRLRGADSEADEEFVIALCRNLDVPCEVARLDLPVQQTTRNPNSEAMARQARYRALRLIANKWGARYVATAHTADDQAETILHRLIRGTGLRGLAGIPRSRLLARDISLIRPLLGFRRREILEFLHTLGQDYRQDATNDEPRFTRNRLRHHLLPLLARDYSPHVADALVRLGGLATEVQTWLDDAAENLLVESTIRTGSTLAVLDCSTLARAQPLLVREVLIRLWRTQGWPLSDMGHARWSQLASMAATPLTVPACAVFPGGIRVAREGTTLTLARQAP